MMCSNNLSLLLTERNLPSLLAMQDGRAVTAENWEERRKELVGILSKNIFGQIPVPCGPTIWREVSRDVNAAGKAITRKVEITVPTSCGEDFTFPVSVTIPTSATQTAPKPAIVFISFGYPKYYPIEELVDEQVTVAEMVMNDVALDKEDNYENLLAKNLFPDGKRPADGTGKLGMWAFAASRVLDYLLSLECVDKTRVAVAGHSRLGKTALWAGANDSRFTHIFSNDSGCAGAAITRQKVGENFPDIYGRFPYWFCPNMQQHCQTADDINQQDFDMHYLLAASAPRKVYVSSAQQDQWADPNSEFLCCVAASQVWQMLGGKGLICEDRLPQPADCFQNGNVGYHLRTGTHFLSRQDWTLFCKFLKK